MTHHDAICLWIAFPPGIRTCAKRRQVARKLPRRLQQSISIVSLWQKSRGTACSSANGWNKTDDFDPELDLVKLLLIIFVVTVPIILNTSNRKEILRIEEKIQLKPPICHGQKIVPLYQPNEKCWFPVETNMPQPSDIVGLLTCV